MPKNRSKFTKELINAVGTAVFDKAQELVPEGGSGNLKRSGTFSFDSKGFKITYSAPYAKQVHDGDEGPLPQYIQKPKDHTRTYRNPIKRGAYKGLLSRPVSYPNGRNFGSKRVVQWDGSPRGWYTTDTPREGSRWVEKAWDAYVQGLSPKERKFLMQLGVDLSGKFEFS